MDAFAAFYRLEDLRRVAERTFRQVDGLALPTAPTAYTIAQVLADPIQLNSRLGTYTNFVNLLDLCGLALPAAFTGDGVPFGITLWRPAATMPDSRRSAACSTPTPTAARRAGGAAVTPADSHARRRLTVSRLDANPGCATFAPRARNDRAITSVSV